MTRRERVRKWGRGERSKNEKEGKYRREREIDRRVKKEKRARRKLEKKTVKTLRSDETCMGVYSYV